MIDLVVHALSQTAGSSALALPPAAPDVEALLDFAGGVSAMRRQHVDCWTDMSGPERERVQAIIAWMQAVHRILNEFKARGCGGLGAAVDHVRLYLEDVGSELKTASHGHSDARNVRNWQVWREKLGCTATGTPRWTNWRALVRDYRRGLRVTPQDEAFWRDVMKLYLRPETPTMTACIRDVARVWRGLGYAQEDLPDPRTVRRLTRERVSLSTLELKRGGAKVYNARSLGYVVRRCNRAPGEAVFSDHRISDFWVRMPHPENPEQLIAVRPWCTAICDAATGYILAIKLYCHSPNRDVIVETMQAALLKTGCVPFDIFYTDQGSDFCAAGLATDAVLQTHDGKVLTGPDGEPYKRSVLRALHTEHWMAAPYNGKEKPVEGHFGHIAQDFDRTMPGYCGRAPQYRPDPKDTYEGDPRRLCSLQEATERLGAWVDTVYHQVALPGGLTRQQVWDGRPPRREKAMDQRSLLFCLLVPHAETRIVRRTSLGCCGVQFDGWTYSHIELIRHQNQPVVVKTYWGFRRVDRKGRQVHAGIFLFTPDDTFLGLAPAEEISDMFADSAEAKAALGDVQHLIHAIAREDRESFQEATGLPRLVSRDRALELIAGGQEGLQASAAEDLPVVSLATGQGAYRRLPAATSAPSVSSVSSVPSCPADVALLEQILSGKYGTSADTAAAPPPAPAPHQVETDFELLAKLTGG